MKKNVWTIFIVILTFAVSGVVFFLITGEEMGMGWLLLEGIQLIICLGTLLFVLKELKKSREKEQKQLVLSNTLTDCVSILSDDSDMDKVIQGILEKVCEYFQGERSYLFELDSDSETVSNTYEYTVEGIAKEKENRKEISIVDVSYWMERFQEKGVVCISDMEVQIEKEASVYSVLKEGKIHSLIMAPLKKGDEIFGFFGIDNPKMECQEDALLDSVVWFLSDSVKKRYLQKVLERNSYEDALTQMNNRDKYEERVNDLEVNKPRSLGVAFVNINGLKDTNDLIGHKAGDKLIKKVARNISKVFEENAFRIGGDEFVMIVPDVEQTVFGEKIEQVNALMQKEQLSVSIGVSWSEKDVDIMEQMNLAEKRMYEQKEF